MLLFLSFCDIFIALKYTTKDVLPLQKKSPKQIELDKLYTLLQSINETTLAADYELRWQLKEAKQKVIDKIKAIESKSSNATMPVVEYIDG
jgi:hypothetical protein